MVEVTTLKIPILVNGSTDHIFPALIKTSNSLILFDAGYPDQIDAFRLEMERIGYTLSDLTHVVISHQHHDHIGSLAALKREHKHITIMASSLEEPFISGKQESLRVQQAREYNKSLEGEAKKWGEGFLQYLMTIEPCSIDEAVDDFPYFMDEEIEIVPTPGHTPGHISIYIRDQKILLAGDAIAYENGELVIANPQFTLDMSACKKSIRELAHLDIDILICYHGGSIDVKDDKIRAFADRIA